MSEIEDRVAGSSRRPAGEGVLVADVVGMASRPASQALRRAGLRVDVARSYGCAVEVAGQVVDQEPAAGAATARNGVVRIFVAAPGEAEAAAGPASGDRASTTGSESPAPPASEGPADAEEELGVPEDLQLGWEAARRLRGDQPPVRRPRKRRLAASQPSAVAQPQRGAAEVGCCDAAARARGAQPTAFAAEPASATPGDDELVVRAEEMFAGRLGLRRAGWRRLTVLPVAASRLGALKRLLGRRRGAR
ncbi:MAG: PASTA domain-containing protein, partial [Solirubrobacteraceae bacterium]